MKSKSKKRYSRLKKSYKKQIVNKMIYLAKKDISDISIVLDKLTESDKIFIENKNLNSSIINRSININRVLVPESYISNSILLLDLILLSNENRIKDGYIFPALFSFRQYLELTMKDSIHNFMVALGECNDTQIGFKKKHSLKKLWDKLNTYILKFENDNIDLHNFGKLINELDNVDECSMAFRYSFQSDDKGNIIPNRFRRKSIDIHNLKNIELKMFCFIEGINDLSYEKANLD